MKLTFKTTKETGKYSCFFNPTHTIKIDGCEIGNIEHKHPHYIRLQIYKDEVHTDDNPNCDWKWITLKKKSDSLQEAKDFVKRNIEAVQKQYKIRKEE